MSVDLEHRTIYNASRQEARVDGIAVVGASHTMIYVEENGDFMVTVSVQKCGLDPARMHIVTINKEMLAAMNAATPHCKEGDRCNCGGDTPAVRATCPNWIKG